MRTEIPDGIPDVLGLELEKAKCALACAGWEVSLAITRPPRETNDSGPFRVVRQRRINNSLVELVVARDDTYRG